jgi:rare lipoprotein A
MRPFLWVSAALALSCAHQEPAKGFNPPVVGTTAEQEPPSPPPVTTLSATAPDDAAAAQIGLATWYGPGFEGKKTSNGERFDPRAMTAAHRKLPFGTWVEVRRVDTGRAVRVRINDRGPWGDSRKVIDLSRHAAELLGMIREGSVRVEIRVVHGPT